MLEAELGPGLSQALARTARQLRTDADALDELAATTAAGLADGQPGLPVAGLAGLPPAIGSRVLRAAALAAGVPAGALTERHISGLTALVASWHGQRWIDLPGRIRCERRCGRLLFAVATRSEDAGGRD